MLSEYFYDKAVQFYLLASCYYLEGLLKETESEIIHKWMNRKSGAL